MCCANIQKAISLLENTTKTLPFIFFIIYMVVTIMPKDIQLARRIRGERA